MNACVCVCVRTHCILLCCLLALPLSMCIFNARSHQCAEGIHAELTHTTYRVSHSPAEPQKWGRRAHHIPKASSSQPEPPLIRPHPLLCLLLCGKCHFLSWKGRVTGSKRPWTLSSQTGEDRGHTDASQMPCGCLPCAGGRHSQAPRGWGVRLQTDRQVTWSRSDGERCCSMLLYSCHNHLKLSPTTVSPPDAAPSVQALCLPEPSTLAQPSSP